MAHSPAIDTVDFSAFARGEGGLCAWDEPTAAQLRCARQIDASCRAQGFVYLTNTGLPHGLPEETFGAMRDLFALPDERKSTLKPADVACNTGYKPFKGITANKRRGADLVEGFNVSAPTLRRNDFAGCPPEFEPAALAFWAALEDLKVRYATALALAAGIEPTFFVDRMRLRDQCVAKMNHYPPCDAPANGDNADEPIRIGEHTDFGGFTLLFLDAGATGLQIKPVAGGEVDGTRRSAGEGWVDVPPPPTQDAVLVNTGSLLARWTNDVWRATAHRVVIPDSQAAMNHRYSIACFCDPDSDTCIEVLPRFVPEGEPPRYPPVRAGEHKRQLLMKLLGTPPAEPAVAA